MTVRGFRRFARGGFVAGLWSRRRAVCVEAPVGRGGSVGANGRVKGAVLQTVSGSSRGRV